MNIVARSIAACVSSLIILTLASLATTSSAQTPAKSLKDQLVGHWQLVSISVVSTTPYGANPKGSMFIDAAGNYSVIVMSGGNAKNISYFGTYTVNDADNTMTMHVDGSTGINAQGRDEKRTVTFDGDQMTQATPKGGVKVTWKRS